MSAAVSHPLTPSKNAPNLPPQQEPVERNPRKELLQHLRGRRVVIPDLQAMAAHWPTGQHPEVARLDKEVDGILRSILTLPKDELRFRKLKASNIADFVTIWWPYASFDALVTATYMSIFLFIWDDEIDAQEFSSIGGDYDIASRFQVETIAYIKASLAGASGAELSKISSHPVITCFKPVAEAIIKAYDDEHIQGFLDEMLWFISMCQQEQKIFRGDALPTVRDYMQRRMGSSAVRVFFAITEYAGGISLPREVREHEAMQCIWHEGNVIISIENDLLSLKKEIAHSQVVDSLIPLLTVELGTVEEAIKHAEGMIRTSIRKLDLAAERLLAEKFSMPGASADDIRLFVDGIKYACTANVNWSLTSARYDLYCPSMEGGMPMTL
ncbi:terpenoid synthase [Xylariomycetidae sp. FL2044]|nr:terpenoid synthase [Xylariomycetidae sp. FL2044]